MYLSIDSKFEKHKNLQIYDLWVQQQYHERPGRTSLKNMATDRNKIHDDVLAHSEDSRTGLFVPWYDALSRPGRPIKMASKCLISLVFYEPSLTF